MRERRAGGRSARGVPARTLREEHAMPGPLPTGRARRANAPKWNKSTAGGRPVPPWPSTEPSAEEIERYVLLWSSEAASQWVDADAPAIARITRLQLECESSDGRLGAYAALVSLEDRFALSAAARRRNYVEVGRPGDGEGGEHSGDSGEVVLSIVQ